jgi:aryl-alcohol dehydrogenase-like predicted oxidoreductase
VERRQLGSDGLEVSALGLGCLSMSGFYGHSDEAAAIRAVHRALELGITLLDTADMYAAGHNERLVGKAIADRRGAAIVATKFGNIFDDQGRILGITGRPEHVHAACDASLQRLGIDVIDLYQQHRVDADTPIEETVGAMQELVTAGKVRHLGVGEALPSDLRRAVATAPIATLQTEYSLIERAPEEEILNTCEELGIGFLAYAPLCRGLLTGHVRSAEFDASDARASGRYPRLDDANLEQNLALVGEVVAIATNHDASAAQVALAWLLASRPFVVPIPGTTRARYVEDNAGAAALMLEPDELERLTALVSPRHGAAGERYTPEFMPTWTSRPLSSATGEEPA